MIRETTTKHVACDRCGAEMPTGKMATRTQTPDEELAVLLYTAVNPGAERLDLCMRCFRRICALAEQIRTQPRRKGKVVPWQEKGGAE